MIPPSPDFPAPSPDTLREAQAAGRALWTGVRWLSTIAAPATGALGCMLVAALPYLASHPGQGMEAPTWVVGVLPVTICLVTVAAVLLPERLPVSLARGAAQLGCLYFAVLLLLPSPQIWTVPGATALALALFVVPPLVVSLVLRRFRWRLVRGCSAEQQLAAPPRGFQFQLVDVFAWTTLIAVFLGLGTVVMSRYSKEPTGWDGLGPAIIVALSAFLCLPTGISSVVFTWLVLVEKRRMARGIVATCIALAYVGLSVYVFVDNRQYPGWPNDDAWFVLVSAVALAVPALVLLGLARFVGWRMVRLPKRLESATSLSS